MPIPLGVLAVAGAGAARAAGVFDLLETQTTTSTVSEIEFTNISQYSTYKHLQIRAVIEPNATNINSFRMRINGDTGSNYAWHRLWKPFNSTTVSSDSGASQTNILFTQSIYYNTSVPPIICDIPDAFSTNKNKVIRVISGSARGDIGGDQLRDTVNLISGLWMSTNAIDSIKIYENSGYLWKIGTRISLYGLAGS